MKTVRRLLPGFLAAAALLAASGCGGDNPGLSAESDEPAYREGQQLEKENRTDEARLDYLKVIAKRGDQAPESHLEIGLIELEHNKDPIAAIYYFRKYLELEPNSRQAPYVRGLIDQAEREFASTLPGAPLDGQIAHPELLDEVERLQRENEGLRAELSALRGGGAVSAPGNAGESASASPPTLFAAPQVVPAPENENPPPETVVPAAAPAPPPPEAPAAPAAARTYTVQAHDTLFGIAKRFYGAATNARVQAILAANRSVLPSARELRPGMVLKIP